MPDDILPWEALRPWIDEALDRLDETDRHAVLLRFFAGRSFAEIGAELCVSEEASRKRIERALEGLRGQLARRGITTSGAALAAALSAAPALAGTVASAATAAAVGGSLAAIRALLSDEELATYLGYEKSVKWRKNQQLEFDEFVADRGLPAPAPYPELSGVR